MNDDKIDRDFGVSHGYGGFLNADPPLHYQWMMETPGPGEYTTGYLLTIVCGVHAVLIDLGQFDTIFGSIIHGQKKYEKYPTLTRMINEAPEDEWMKEVSAEIISDLECLTWQDLNWDFEDRYKDIAVASDKPPTEEELAPMCKLIDVLIGLLKNDSCFYIHYEWHA